MTCNRSISTLTLTRVPFGPYTDSRTPTSTDNCCRGLGCRCRDGLRLGALPQAVEYWQQSRGLYLAVHEEAEIAWFRFAKPYPTSPEVHVSYEFQLDPVFATTAFAPDSLGLMVTLRRLEECIHEVRRVIAMFAAL